MNEIDTQKIETVEDAERIYKHYGCQKYHMWHDDTERYNEYLELKIPKKLEQQWSLDIYNECKCNIINSGTIYIKIEWQKEFTIRNG